MTTATAATTRRNTITWVVGYQDPLSEREAEYEKVFYSEEAALLWYDNAFPLLPTYMEKHRLFAYDRRAITIVERVHEELF